MNLANFKWNQDEDGIVTLVWDTPDKPVNVLAMAAIAELGQVAEKLKSDAALKGLVIVSAKTSGFSAGADLDEMGSFAGQSGSEGAQAAFAMMMNVHRALRALETAGKPVVAAVSGTALGGGLEVALACHYRLIANDPRIRIGFPESQIGLIPGAGGTQRLPRMIGAMQALPFMLESQRVDPAKAVSLGIVQKSVPAADLLNEAKTWIKANPAAQQPWDKPEFRIPGGGPFSASGAQVFTVGNAMLRQRTYDNYPAQRAIMSSVYEGLLVDIDTALKIEARYFVRVLTSPVAAT
jgi:3-hydroxyacyl-CoA dehydrogenase/enoyl-CoA hydratase/3-hydroxybutyryl-CoA epimerase